MKKLFIIMLVAFFVGCMPDKTEPVKTDVLKYEVINTYNSDINIAFVSENYEIETISISGNWTNSFPVFLGEMYFVSVESDKEIIVKIFLNGELKRISKGINIIDANYSL